MARSVDNISRIPRQTFLISTSALLAVSLLAIVVRFYIRIAIQKQFSIDDGFIIIALCCLIVAYTLIVMFILPNMYVSWAVKYPDETAGIVLPDNWLEMTFDFHKWAAVVNITLWTGILAIKFSFLFFFRNLISRIRSMTVYWWIVFVFTVGTLGYGISVYIITCPHFYSFAILECNTSAGNHLIFSHAAAQMVLDIIGDVMIVLIPIRIIWIIKVSWMQKIVLAVSLCLTIVIMITTIIRVSGIHHEGLIDFIWALYWSVISVQIGITMAAAAAFRAFFVARREDTPPSSGPRKRWYYEAKKHFWQSSTPKGWRSKLNALPSVDGEEPKQEPFMKELPKIPRAYITGIRTFFNGQGRSTIPKGGSQMESQMTTASDDIETLPFREYGIQVTRDVSAKSERSYSPRNPAFYSYTPNSSKDSYATSTVKSTVS